MPTNLLERVKRLNDLLDMVKPIPDEWIKDFKVSPEANPAGRAPGISPVKCTSYRDLINACSKAWHWRDDLDVVFSMMLTVVTSTIQVGDQLFLMVIGNPSSLKTKLCDALLVSKHCYALEHLTGFHSGYKGKDDDGNDLGDCSLIARINNKCLITPEGNVLTDSPKFAEIMSQQRRIFDGTSGASFKNMKEEKRYTGLRTPWIIAGTPAILNKDQTHLGDRFLKIRITPPPADDKRDIMRSVGYTAIRSVKQSSNGAASSHVEEYTLKAYQLCGGYVNWLRENTERLLGELEVNEEALIERCIILGEFTAMLRARPDMTSKEIEDAAEEPNRLMHQYVRASMCMAVVLNRKTIDKEVNRRITKLALDTSKGQSLEIIQLLHKRPDGMLSAEIEPNISEGYAITRLVKFLCKIGAIEPFKVVHARAAGITKWRLTNRMQGLCKEIL